MPLKLEITDNDIREVSRLLECNFTDESRKEALRFLLRGDLQACPGSGKTTLLVAKLAVLSGKWAWRDRGICILSHTNVAREQIEKRLARHPTAHKLLGYPHFIGTIQSFIDQYLAIPFLRSKRIELSIIDDARFKERAHRLIRYYRVASGWLSRQKNPEDIVAGARFVLSGKTLQINSKGHKLPAAGTPTYEELKKLKVKILNEGISCFTDMFAFAEVYLLENPLIINILNYRFPWVFIDEMQDTDALQDGLLHRVFGGECIFQRFGDVNQAIYGENTVAEAETSFPSSGFLEISGSLRFGPKIARMTTPLTAIKPQEIVGNPMRIQKRHTIFLFDERTVTRVLHSFAELIKSEYPAGLPVDFVAKAVGRIKKPGDERTIRNIPYSISDYWQDFQPSYTSKNISFDHFIDFIRKAHDLQERQKECKDSYELMIEGICRLLYTQEAVNDQGKRYTKTRLIDTFEKCGELKQLQNIIHDLGTSHVLSDVHNWDAIVARLVSLLRPVAGANLTTETESFLIWKQECGHPGRCSPEFVPNKLNIFRHENVEIEVATIHAVKGETHSATLVLETFWYDHDLKKVLPFLKGERLTLKGRLITYLTVIFVGMTRPRELLCLAMHKNHLAPEDLSALESVGWHLDDLS